MSRAQHSHRDHSPGCHVAASIDLRDDTLTSDDGCSGLAVKQIQPAYDTPRADLDLIVAGEKYYVLDSGEVDVDVTGFGFAVVKGTRLWINPVTNAVANAAGAGLEKLGVVRYIAPERGLSAGLATISFEARKDF